MEDFIKLPDMPSLDFLRSHCADVFHCWLDTDKFGNACFDVCKHGGEKAYFFFEGGEWVCGKTPFKDEFGRNSYRERCEWPLWVRKF